MCWEDEQKQNEHAHTSKWNELLRTFVRVPDEPKNKQGHNNNDENPAMTKPHLCSLTDSVLWSRLSNTEQCTWTHHVHSPFYPFEVRFKASYCRFETLTDAFSLVCLQKFIRLYNNSQTGEDHKSDGPLEIQYTGCNEVCHITYRRKKEHLAKNECPCSNTYYYLVIVFTRNILDLESVQE